MQLHPRDNGWIASNKTCGKERGGLWCCGGRLNEYFSKSYRFKLRNDKEYERFSVIIEHLESLGEEAMAKVIESITLWQNSENIRREEYDMGDKRPKNREKKKKAEKKKTALIVPMPTAVKPQ